MTRPNVSNKLRDIAAAIDQRGSAELTRLTVLKKWFEVSNHLSSFAIFIADQALVQNTKTTKEAEELFRDARTLLADVDVFAPQIPRAAATKLHEGLRAFQNEYKNLQWGPVRIIHNRNLFLVERGIHIYLHGDTPTEGYRLAAFYCEHYDPHYGNGLSGPSQRRIEEIAYFIEGVEDRKKASI